MAQQTIKTGADWRDLPSDIHKKYAEFYKLLGGSTLVVILLVIGALIFIDQLTDFSMNVFTEIISVTVTVFILDRLNQNRAQAQRKKDLIAQLGSKSNEFAKEAARLIWSEEWYKDGSLQRTDLRGANLEGADLREANLESVNLWEANLMGATLWKANLEGATLWKANIQNANLGTANLQRTYLMGANLQGAELWEANLEGADLMGANLEGVNLWKANLKGTDLRRANLEGAELWGANLEGAKFDEKTILPDRSKWTPKKMNYLINLTQQEL